MVMLTNFIPSSATFTTYHLAFSLQPSVNTQNMTFAVVGENNGRIVNKRFISLESFVLIASGQQQSGANPNNENLFDKYDISEGRYKWKYDDIKDKYDSVEVLFLEDSWVLKYKRNPQCPGGCIPSPGMKTEGWAQYNFRPSWPQLQILQQYGVIYIDDFFYGENMFKLLHDMEDPQWIQNYQSTADAQAQTSK